MSTPAANTGRRRGPWRWFVALLATVLLVVSGSGLVVFAQSGSGATKGPVFVPSDAPMYVVVRLDMPDGQADALAEFMTAFPGFADSGSFDMKADELVDGLLGEVTGGAVAYGGELESIVTGEVGLAMNNVIDAAMTNDQPEMLVGIAISDRAAAESFVDDMTADATASMTEEPYGTTSIVSDGQMAMAVHDEWVLISQMPDQVKVGIDVLEGKTPSLAEEPSFASAFARVPAAHLAAAYVNLQSFGSLIDLAGMAAQGQTGVALPTDDLMAQLPTDMTAYLAAEADRLTLEAFITAGEMTQSLAEGESELASQFPADTQLFVETRELGTTLETTLGALLEALEGEQAAQIAPLEDMLCAGDMCETFPEFLGFIGDAAVGGGITSDGVWLGVAAEVDDEADATKRVERIRSLLAFAELGMGSGGGAAGPPISVEETTVGETTVMVVTLPIEDTLDGATGSMSIPIGDTISIAVADETLLIGTGDFVENALLQSSADSLGASAGYIDAIGEDTANAGVLYANVTALLTAIDPLLDMAVPQWADVQPYATGLDRLVAVGSVDDELISTRISVIVD